ncbi:MAG: iron chelate uptake ABC transporter family permease subunit [candidate division Zixibacteria bacterium]|nr:iron chelate uptake ABC transporter family permease subunit [candidate division Zixibacteria bacterium]
MNITQIEIQMIAVVVAAGCAIPGVFLVLRKMALISDAISHAILIGIVIGFFIVRDLSSPILIIGATITGVITVSLVELLKKTGLVKEDAAIGLVFPVLFSAGVILISRYAGDIHLDIDSVLLGELAFAPFNRMIVAGTDIGPKAFWVMSGILILNLVFVIVFFKELKLATFDSGLSLALGFSPAFIHYTLMTLTSITAVGAFDAVGSILVVALMIAPASTAYLITDRLSLMIFLSILFGAASAVSGYWIAHILDASIAGSMATMAGMIFLLAYILAPGRGLIALIKRRFNQRWQFARAMLAIHLYQHEDLPEATYENSFAHLEEHLRWNPNFAGKVVEQAQGRKLLKKEGDLLVLTGKGRDLAKEYIVK